jgi:hypothetical protein
MRRFRSVLYVAHVEFETVNNTTERMLITHVYPSTVAGAKAIWGTAYRI